jgi:hypothetical protein
MKLTVPAENLTSGDVVELSTQFGPKPTRVTGTFHRVHAVKLVGRDEQGTRWSFGMKYGEPVLVLERFES